MSNNYYLDNFGILKNKDEERSNIRCIGILKIK